MPFEKVSQALVVLKIGLQYCWIFLFTCQAHNKAGDSEKTIESAFRSAWSQSAAIALGPIIIIGVLS